MASLLRARVAEDSVRPWRIWQATEKRNLRWRYYATSRNCQNAALIESRWSKVGETLEVYDARYGRVLCSYTRRVSTIMFVEH